jgi:hypothetical protein
MKYRTQDLYSQGIVADNLPRPSTYHTVASPDDDGPPGSRGTGQEMASQARRPGLYSAGEEGAVSTCQEW